MQHQIAIFEGVGPYGKRGKRKRARAYGHGRLTGPSSDHKSHRTAFGRAAKECSKDGHRPGTKSFGSCMRQALSQK